MKLSFVWSNNSFEATEFLEELRVLAKVVDSVCVENHDTFWRKVFDKFWKEYVHVFVSAQTRTNYPWVNGFLPLFYLMQPLINHLSDFLLLTIHLFLWNKNWMDNQLRRVRFNGWCWWFWAKYMCKITSDFEWWDCRVIRCSRKLVTASNNTNSTTLAFVRDCLKRWKQWLDLRKDFFALHSVKNYYSLVTNCSRVDILL